MLEVHLHGVPNEDFIQGYPGIPATWPRLAGTVELRVRPQGREPAALDVAALSVALLRTDAIVVPSLRPAMAAQKREKSFLVTRTKEIYRSQSGTPKIYALDVPFTLSLPTALTASMSLPKQVESVYFALVSVDLVDPTTLNATKQTFQFPVRLRRFDTLSTFGAFNQPAKGDVVSSDHLVNLEWFLATTAFGPGDTISLDVRTPPNVDWPKSKKVKLKRVSVELVQITKYLVEQADEAKERELSKVSSTGKDSDPKESAQSATEELVVRTRVAKMGRDFTSAEQTKRRAMDAPEHLALGVPTIFRSFEGGVLPKEAPTVGYDGRTAFTNASALYSVEFELVLHARFSSAKDIEARQPVTIAQFDRTACGIYMQSLVAAAKNVKRVGRQVRPPNVWVEAPEQGVNIA